MGSNKSRFFSDFSKIATDTLGTIGGIKKEIETIVKLRIEKVINKSNLVKRDELEIIKKMLQKQSKKIEKIEKSIKYKK